MAELTKACRQKAGRKRAARWPPHAGSTPPTNMRQYAMAWVGVIHGSSLSAAMAAEPTSTDTDATCSGGRGSVEGGEVRAHTPHPTHRPHTTPHSPPT
eukprot:scaffold21663_cov118-Isochrysis_galbana.AAC.2